MSEHCATGFKDAFVAFLKKRTVVANYSNVPALKRRCAISDSCFAACTKNVSLWGMTFFEKYPQLQEKEFLTEVLTETIFSTMSLEDRQVPRARVREIVLSILVEQELKKGQIAINQLRERIYIFFVGGFHGININFTAFASLLISVFVLLNSLPIPYHTEEPYKPGGLRIVL